MDQTGYERDRDSSQALLSRLTWKDKAVIAFKNHVPLARVLSHELDTYREYKSDQNALEEPRDNENQSQADQGEMEENRELTRGKRLSWQSIKKPWKRFFLYDDSGNRRESVRSHLF